MQQKCKMFFFFVGFFVYGRDYAPRYPFRSNCQVKAILHDATNIDIYTQKSVNSLILHAP